MWLFAFLLLCASCDSLPKDVEGTLQRVEAEQRFRVGIIAARETRLPPQALKFLRKVAAAAHASPEVESDGAEPLLARLEQGGLDLVIGRMTADSAWSRKVTFLPPLARIGEVGGEQQIVAMARNGENEWITLLHAQAKAASFR